MKKDSALLILGQRLHEVGVVLTDEQRSNLETGVVCVLEQSRARVKAEQNRANYLRRRVMHHEELVRRAVAVLEQHAAESIDPGTARSLYALAEEIAAAAQA